MANTSKNYTSKPESAYNNMPFIKFQLIWRTSDFGTKFAQKNMNDEPFVKLAYSNVPLVASYQISVNLENFSF